MPTVNNYTFSELIYTITEGTPVSDTTGVNASILISPVEGYSLDVSDFSLSPDFTSDIITNVSFLQSSNDILVSFNITSDPMPSGNVVESLLITGSANPADIAVNGEFKNQPGSNITSTPADTTNIYNAEGTFGSTEQIFTISYSADAGYYFETVPDIIVADNKDAYYSTRQTLSYTDGLITGIELFVDYTFPIATEYDHSLAFRPQATEIYVPTEEVTHFNTLTDIVSAGGQERKITVGGESGATYTITATDDSSNVYTVVSNATIGSTGYELHLFEYPENTGSEITWDIAISGDVAASVVTPIEVTQAAGDTFGQVAFSINTSSFSNGSEACSNDIYNGVVYTNTGGFAIGTTVYSDSGYTTPFVGDNNYYAIDANPYNFAVKIDSNGIVTDFPAICNF